MIHVASPPEVRPANLGPPLPQLSADNAAKAQEITLLSAKVDALLATNA